MQILTRLLQLAAMLQSFTGTVDTSEPIDVRLRPVKERYALGDPIAVEMTVRNASARPVLLRFSYPDDLGLRFRTEGQAPVRSPAVGQTVRVPPSVIQILRRFEPGEGVSVVFALRKYIRVDKPQDYKVEYKAEYEDHARPEEGAAVYSATGTITVRVRDEAIAETELRSFLTLALESESRQPRSEGIELLCWTQDKRAIPFLERAARVIMVNADVRVVEALGRFRDDRHARAALFRVAESGHWTALARAYQVCVQQQIPIPPAVYRRALSSDNYWYRSATVHHLREHGEASDLPLVRRAQSDEESYLVDLAREAEAAIVGRAMPGKPSPGAPGSTRQDAGREERVGWFSSPTTIVLATLVLAVLAAASAWLLLRRSKRLPRQS